MQFCISASCDRAGGLITWDGVARIPGWGRERAELDRRDRLTTQTRYRRVGNISRWDLGDVGPPLEVAPRHRRAFSRGRDRHRHELGS